MNARNIPLTPVVRKPVRHVSHKARRIATHWCWYIARTRLCLNSKARSVQPRAGRWTFTADTISIRTITTLRLQGMRHVSRTAVDWVPNLKQIQRAPELHAWIQWTRRDHAMCNIQNLAMPSRTQLCILSACISCETNHKPLTSSTARRSSNCFTAKQ
jgi:hypothetical protein